jgi:hypothetical protein
MSHSALRYFAQLTGRSVIVQRDSDHSAGWSTCPFCSGRSQVLDRGPVRLLEGEWVANCCGQSGDEAGLRVALATGVPPINSGQIPNRVAA